MRRKLQGEVEGEGCEEDVGGGCVGCCVKEWKGEEQEEGVDDDVGVEG